MSKRVTFKILIPVIFSDSADADNPLKPILKINIETGSSIIIFQFFQYNCSICRFTTTQL